MLWLNKSLVSWLLLFKIVDLIVFQEIFLLLLIVVDFVFSGKYVNREDREAERRLGKGRGHFSSKVWTSYGKTVDRKVCSQCIGICCNALRDLVDRLVEKNFLIPGAQSPTVSCCCFLSCCSLLFSGLFQCCASCHLEARVLACR